MIVVKSKKHIYIDRVPRYIPRDLCHCPALTSCARTPLHRSIVDTMCMILVPLYLTALLVPANTWSYVAFGTIYGRVVE